MAMKIGIFTDEVHPDFATGLGVMREHGIMYAELRTVNGTNLMDLSPDGLDDVERLLKQNGIQVSALGTPIFKCPLEGRERKIEGDTFGAQEMTYEEHLALLPHCFALAERFGTRVVRCFSFGEMMIRKKCSLGLWSASARRSTLLPSTVSISVWRTSRRAMRA